MHTVRTTPAPNHSTEIANAILGDEEIVWAADLRAGDLIHVDGQARRVEAALGSKFEDCLAVMYRPLVEVRRAERAGLPVCELPIDEMVVDSSALIVRRLRPGLRSA